MNFTEAKQIIDGIYVEFEQGKEIKITNLKYEDLFLVLYKDSNLNQPAFVSEPFGKNQWWMAYGRNYIDYRIVIYEVTDKYFFKKIKTYHLSYVNENVLFDLEPESQEDLNIWIDYISKEFNKITGANPYIRINQELIEDGFKINYLTTKPFDQSIDYFKIFSIGRRFPCDDMIFPTKNKTAYELINNALLRL